MATKEWLNNHAKVTAYLDFSLYASLEKWMQKHKIKKASQALTIILEHYLEGRNSNGAPTLPLTPWHRPAPPPAAPATGRGSR